MPVGDVYKTGIDWMNMTAYAAACWNTMCMPL